MGGAVTKGAERQAERRAIASERSSARMYDTYVVAATSSLLVLGIAIAILWAWGAVVALAGRSSVTLDATLGTDEAEGAIGI